MPKMFDLDQAISDNVTRTLLPPHVMGRELDRLLGKPPRTVEVTYGLQPDGDNAAFIVRYGGNTIPLNFEMKAILLSLDDFSREYLEPIAEKIRALDAMN